MLHKYYYYKKSNRYNDQFTSPTDSDSAILTWPHAVEQIREMIGNHRDELNIHGFVRCLYLEKPENSSRFWKVVVAVWSNEFEYDQGVDPNEVLRINTEYLYEPVRDKYSDEYTQSLPLSVYNRFVFDSGRDFF